MDQLKWLSSANFTWPIPEHFVPFTKQSFGRAPCAALNVTKKDSKIFQRSFSLEQPWMTGCNFLSTKTFWYCEFQHVISVNNFQKQSCGCVLENFAKFTGKHLCHSLLFNKVAGLRPANLFKKETMAQVLFPVNFTKFKTTPPVAAFEFCRFRIFYSRFHFIYLKSFQVFFFWQVLLMLWNHFIFCCKQNYCLRSIYYIG